MFYFCAWIYFPFSPFCHLPPECQLHGLYQWSPCCLCFNWAWPIQVLSPDGTDGVFFFIFLPPFLTVFFTSGEERLSSGCDSVAIDGSLSDWVQIISLMELSIRGGYHSYQAVIFFGYYLFCYFIFLLPLSFLYLKIADCALGGPLCAMLGLAGFPFIKKYCTDYCILFLLTLERASIQLHLAGSVS